MSAAPHAFAASESDSPSTVGRPRLAEWIALLLIALTGFGLRAIHADHISVEHYDEGVYASNWFYQPPGEADPQYPKQYLYAPPLLPNLCFWWLFFSGGNPHSIVWINILAGTLTIPLFWWVGRSWFGPASGLLAAALCAFSDLHIALSRMVLTDVLLLLFLTAGVWTGVRAIQTGRPLWIVLGGLSAGLAWWTKYNGWLTLAITGAGLAGQLVFDRPKDQRIAPLLFRWLATAVIAAVIWSPVPIGLQEVGGYSVVSANHSRYVVGLLGWWTSLFSLQDKLHQLDSTLCLWLVVAFSVSATVWPRSRATSDPDSSHTTSRRPALVMVGLLLGVLLVALTLLLDSIAAACAALGVAAWAARLIKMRLAIRGTDGTHIDLLPLWTLLAWHAGLLLSTPMYTPYPRIALALVGSIWLMAALIPASGLVDWVVRIDRTNGRMMGAACLVIFAFALYSEMKAGTRKQTNWPMPWPRVAWQDRRGLEHVATPLADAAMQNFADQPTAGHQQMKAALYVFAEPGLFYHLAALPKRSDFRFFVQPLGDHALLTGANPHPELATYLISGPHAEAVGSDAEAFRQAEQAGVLELVASFPYRPSDLVLLDDGVPSTWSDNVREQTIRLYRRR